jgi:hypothetical protein
MDRDIDSLILLLRTSQDRIVQTRASFRSFQEAVTDSRDAIRRSRAMVHRSDGLIQSLALSGSIPTNTSDTQGQNSSRPLPACEDVLNVQM